MSKLLRERVWLAEDARTGRRLVTTGKGPKAALARALGLAAGTGKPVYRDLQAGTRQVGWYMGGGWWDVFECIPLAEAAGA